MTNEDEKTVRNLKKPSPVVRWVTDVAAGRASYPRRLEYEGKSYLIGYYKRGFGGVLRIERESDGMAVGICRKTDSDYQRDIVPPPNWYNWSIRKIWGFIRDANEKDYWRPGEWVKLIHVSAVDSNECLERKVS